MIIIGLGNPGLRYSKTRHNVGQIFLNYFALQYGKRFVWKPRCYVSTVFLSIENKRIKTILIKPISWMNLSGEIVCKLIKEYKDQFLVIVDDIALPLGRARLRLKGSDGGHRGLRSIVNTLQTDEFPRLRIGIGEPTCEPAEYVLSRFSKKESNTLKKIFKEMKSGIEIAIKDGFEKAQNYINGIDFTKKSEALISKS